MVTDGGLGQAYLMDISLTAHQCGRAMKFATTLGERFALAACDNQVCESLQDAQLLTLVARISLKRHSRKSPLASINDHVQIVVIAGHGCSQG